MRCRHLVEKMRNLFLRSQCFNKIFSTKSKKEDTMYVRTIYMSFLSRYLLCKNIYTMPSFMWSNEHFSILKWWLYLYCIFLFNFLTYEVSYSKKIFFLEEMRNLFLWLAFETYFAELIFAIDLYKTVFWGSNFCNFGLISKSKFSNNLFRNSLWSQKFLPLR